MPPPSLQPRRASPASIAAAAAAGVAFVLLLAAASAPPAYGASLTFYGVQRPDPLHVYALQEVKPENIRNDPFLVVFKTHVPSLRPYEIPYFPPKGHLSAEEQDGGVLPNGDRAPPAPPAPPAPLDALQPDSLVDDLDETERPPSAATDAPGRKEPTENIRTANLVRPLEKHDEGGGELPKKVESEENEQRKDTYKEGGVNEDS